MYPMLPVSLDCPFLISPLVFSKVYLLQSVLCLMYPMLPVSLDCLCPVSYVSNVASFSGLSILDFPFGFL
jgi:hypothetical protein